MDRVRARRLTSGERRRLRQMKRQLANQVNSRHARIVLLSTGGVQNREIATLADCTPQWVRIIIHRFNAQGLDGLALTISDEFPETNRVLVVGFRGNRDVTELLKPLTGLFSEVYVTAASDAMAIPAADVAASVRQVFGPDVTIEISEPVSQAITDALHSVGEDDMVVVTGSLYVVSDARDHLLGG